MLFISNNSFSQPQVLPWKTLVHLPNEELARLDPASANLSFAMDLLGSQRIDVERCRWTLKRMEDYARDHTLDEPFFRLRRHYKNCWPLYRINALVSILQRKFGVRHNPNIRRNPVTNSYDQPKELENYFIHGIFQGYGGVCVSLAVVYTALGRRLGHPLKLVFALCKRQLKLSHVFFRWDDPDGDRFNIEVVGKGFFCPPDMFYRRGSHTTCIEAEETKGVLKSLTPREELALYLDNRSNYQQMCGDLRGMVESRLWAYALDQNWVMKERLALGLNEWTEKLTERRSPGFPHFEILPSPRQFPEALPAEFEFAYHSKSVIQFITNDPEWEARWWGPMRRGVKLPHRLSKIRMRWTNTGSYEVSPVITPEPMHSSLN